MLASHSSQDDHHCERAAAVDTHQVEDDVNFCHPLHRLVDGAMTAVADGVDVVDSGAVADHCLIVGDD